MLLPKVQEYRNPPDALMRVANLSVSSYHNGHTNWHYKAHNSQKHPIPEDYFEQAADLIVPGDIITVSSATGAGIYHAQAKDGKLVVKCLQHT
jgi:hypothetical protein